MRTKSILVAILLWAAAPAAFAQDCGGTGLEADCDNDTFTVGEGDCDDNKAKVYPGRSEVCGDELDNNATLARIASLRVQRANLLGFPTHAHYVLDDNMAKEPEKVYALLGQLWTPALARAKKEARELQAMIDSETADQPGGGFQLEPWDWWHFAEKV